MSVEIKTYDEKMKKTLEAVKANNASVRAGRANAGVLDRITVEYYGVPTPIQQVATISTPDPRTLAIQPWDRSLLKAIEKAIQTSDLGIHPQNDGSVIRLAFPQLTEERRKELSKQVRKYGEEGKVAIRNIRRDAMDAIKSGEGLRAHRGRPEGDGEGPPGPGGQALQGRGRHHRRQGEGTDGGVRDLHPYHTSGEFPACVLFMTCLTREYSAYNC